MPSIATLRDESVARALAHTFVSGVTMTLGYYPGCSLTGTSREYDLSLRQVLAALDVHLVEIDDWSCCGASSAHIASHLLSIALPARNLALAREQDLAEVLAPCAACFNRLVAARRAIDGSARMRESIEYVLDAPWNGGAAVVNILELFERIGPERIAAGVRTKLASLSVACYYGCLLVRPVGIGALLEAEQPRSMEAIVAATGARSVEWSHRVECCGGALSVPHSEIVVELARGILDDARASGADAIVVACPMCHVNLDMRQRTMLDASPGASPLPVLYLTELVGLALGIDAEALGLGLHVIDTAALVDAVASVEEVAS